MHHSTNQRLHAHLRRRLHFRRSSMLFTLALHCWFCHGPKPTQARPAKLDFVIFNVFVCSFSIVQRSFARIFFLVLPASSLVFASHFQQCFGFLFCTHQVSLNAHANDLHLVAETFLAEIPRNGTFVFGLARGGTRIHGQTTRDGRKRLERVLCGERTTNPAMFFSSSPFLEFFSSLL